VNEGVLAHWGVVEPNLKKVKERNKICNISAIRIFCTLETKHA
jgi:hypothetical protein